MVNQLGRFSVRIEVCYWLVRAGVWSNSHKRHPKRWNKSMPSPFPGMDPYLERHWGDVHTSLVTYARDQLQKFLPRDLRARVEERVVVSGWNRPRSLFPDVRVIETGRISRRPGQGWSGRRRRPASRD